MSWRGNQNDDRRRLLNKLDTAEVERYESLVGNLTSQDEDAFLADLNRVITFRPGMCTLDVGAGTGTLSKMLSRLAGLSITALEPAPAMLEKLNGKAELKNIRVVEGFCDASDDRSHFGEAKFDLIISRQLSNTLFDPLAAFKNWYYWLVPGGAVVVIDGLYARSAWSGMWEEEIDVLPLSACQTMALIPYLLELIGYRIEAVEPMATANALPSARTTRYVVVARKPT